MTTRVRRIPEAERREQILQAAFDVACRAGISGLTVRGVAAEARVSHALVLFHFRTKERLVHALLDWLIAGMSVLHISEDIASFPHARDRLHALLQQEMARLSHQPEHTRLFLEYWALGVRDASIRARIGAELERYREAFRSIMEELLEAEPAGNPTASADSLAAVAVSWIHGCAVQAVIDPTEFDTDGYLEAVRGMIGSMS
ncbi:MAG TPA: TetR family transcriptional regulator C-terminal domain-containing protein [Longimicrobiales bacterium]|nr:TetR family transcriptional regulator C-terminal domain-containing protein [Longimicrobiales bacterium]